MITNGSKVKVKDNYTGNLDGVKGRVATVEKVDISEGVTKYLLDIKGTYQQESYYRKGEYYTYNAQAIVTSNEVEEYSYGMKDCKGVLLEIGDKVVYSGNRPGIIEGEVVGFKDYEEQRWGQGRKVVKVQLKIVKQHHHSDGGERRMSEDFDYTQWFEHGSRMMIVQKNLPHLVLFNNDFNVLECGNE
ncbi:hypothetical protein SEA_FAUST_179 [Streptomyces phage Faust]|uniref:Uncharacterized protein n=1 Tax=Streptomyces phage Faust TaxID=2767565 RepID=A0A7G9UYZ8_9CAUD|nr:hypothetical protein PP456_gp106 [Streptomyces phage Faust]QNN99253.1 hypothetical protein SEA_FAUST_179 [Streptomyces phage Faust]